MIFCFPIISSFQLASNFFSSTLCTRLASPSSKVDPMHLWLAFKFSEDPPFFNSHGGEYITSPNVVKNAFISIARDLGFHV